MVTTVCYMAAEIVPAKCFRQDQDIKAKILQKAGNVRIPWRSKIEPIKVPAGYSTDGHDQFGSIRKTACRDRATDWNLESLVDVFPRIGN